MRRLGWALVAALMVVTGGGSPAWGGAGTRAARGPGFSCSYCTDIADPNPLCSLRTRACARCDLCFIGKAAALGCDLLPYMRFPNARRTVDLNCDKYINTLPIDEEPH